MIQQSNCNKFQVRIQSLLNKPENQKCCDCSDNHPTWATLLSPPAAICAAPTQLEIEDNEQKEDPSITFGAFYCAQCAIIQQKLINGSSVICNVKSLEAIDTWNEKELLALETSGNAKVNAIFEGRSQLFETRRPSGSDTDSTIREEFVRNKYQVLSYYNPMALSKHILSPTNGSSLDDSFSSICSFADEEDDLNVQVMNDVNDVINLIKDEINKDDCAHAPAPPTTKRSNGDISPKQVKRLPSMPLRASRVNTNNKPDPSPAETYGYGEAAPDSAYEYGATAAPQKSSSPRTSSTYRRRASLCTSTPTHPKSLNESFHSSRKQRYGRRQSITNRSKTYGYGDAAPDSEYGDDVTAAPQTSSASRTSSTYRRRASLCTSTPTHPQSLNESYHSSRKQRYGRRQSITNRSSHGGSLSQSIHGVGCQQDISARWSTACKSLKCPSADRSRYDRLAGVSNRWKNPAPEVSSDGITNPRSISPSAPVRGTSRYVKEHHSTSTSEVDKYGYGEGAPDSAATTAKDKYGYNSGVQSMNGSFHRRPQSMNGSFHRSNRQRYGRRGSINASVHRGSSSSFASIDEVCISDPADEPVVPSANRDADKYGYGEAAPDSASSTAADKYGYGDGAPVPPTSSAPRTRSSYRRRASLCTSTLAHTSRASLCTSKLAHSQSMDGSCHSSRKQRYGRRPSISNRPNHGSLNSRSHHESSMNLRSNDQPEASTERWNAACSGSASICPSVCRPSINLKDVGDRWKMTPETDDNRTVTTFHSDGSSMSQITIDSALSSSSFSSPSVPTRHRDANISAKEKYGYGDGAPQLPCSSASPRNIISSQRRRASICNSTLLNSQQSLNDSSTHRPRKERYGRRSSIGAVGGYTIQQSSSIDQTACPERWNTTSNSGILSPYSPTGSSNVDLMPHMPTRRSNHRRNRRASCV